MLIRYQFFSHYTTQKQKLEEITYVLIVSEEGMGRGGRGNGELGNPKGIQILSIVGIPEDHAKKTGARYIVENR